MRMVSAHLPEARKSTPEWFTREQEEEDCYGPRLAQEVERIAYEDMTLCAGIPTEEVLTSLGQGWAINKTVAFACESYKARKHAPWLMESEEIPQSI